MRCVNVSTKDKPASGTCIDQIWLYICIRACIAILGVFQFAQNQALELRGFLTSSFKAAH